MIDTRTPVEQLRPREQLYPDNWHDLEAALPIVERMQEWLRWHFGRWIHENQIGSIGYYAAKARGDCDPERDVQNRYYSGPGSRDDVRRRLTIVSAVLDKIGAEYTWKIGTADYPYLAVHLPEPKALA